MCILWSLRVKCVYCCSDWCTVTLKWHVVGQWLTYTVSTPVSWNLSHLHFVARQFLLHWYSGTQLKYLKKWPIYVTDWNYLLIALSLICCFCCCCQVACRQGKSWRQPGNNFYSTRTCHEMTTAHGSLATSSSFLKQMGQKVTERDLTKTNISLRTNSLRTYAPFLRLSLLLHLTLTQTLTLNLNPNPDPNLNLSVPKRGYMSGGVCPSRDMSGGDFRWRLPGYQFLLHW